MKNTLRRTSPRRAFASTRGGFTLLEVLVTLSLMMIMLTIIFVPLNSAFNIFQIGQSRNDLQLAARQTLAQLQTDLQRAVYVFPNSELPGITDKAPYGDNPPYISGTNCVTGARVNNTSRIDMLLPLRNDEVSPAPSPSADGSVANPVRPAYYVVTYYARRRDPSQPFNDIDNPLQLFRAKMPYKNSDGTDFEISGEKNIDVSGTRYGASCNDNASRWLMQDEAGENMNEPFDLSVKTNDANDATPVIAGSHDLVSPRDLALLPAEDNNADNLQPRGTNFVCQDTNGDGKIDRVNVSLTLAQYDLQSVGGAPSSANGGGASGKPTYQQHTQTETVNLTNVR